MSEQNTAPFEVVCVSRGNVDPMYPNLAPITVGEKYVVVKVIEVPWMRKGDWYHLDGFDSSHVFHSDLFRKINPYSNSVTKELAESVVIGDTADQPVKIKKPEKQLN